MPQLSPMMGFVIFATVLFCYYVLLCSLSKKTPFVQTTKLGDGSKPSYSYHHFFK
uniref:ATP synthase F0 subunit 8 n=1 Tax=Tyrannodoris europaea TaxID=189538 RepID=Q8HKB0_TYREU|nr:ATP synthase F0 subunit 8 [Tyrannodoris europaea]AAL91059.1 ATP synthase F0 subunit 8 [Tyrannodoris europaea]